MITTWEVPIIFLDVDGVLNTRGMFTAGIKGTGRERIENELNDDLVGRLANLVRRTNARIVVSSSWRYCLVNMDVLGRRLAKNQIAILDKTIMPIDSSVRGDQIENWLKKWSDRWSTFIILDDSTDMLPHQMDRFIQIDEETGLTEDDVEIAVRLLNAGPIDKDTYFNQNATTPKL